MRTGAIVGSLLILFGVPFSQAIHASSASPPYITTAESIPADEAASIDLVVQHVVSTIQTKYPVGVRPVHRDAHAKHHGCVKAEFEVTNQNLPPELRVGIFARNQKFPAWIRFSNGSGKENPDRSKDARGMAIKLMGVPGEKVLPDEKSEKTQDFLMIDHPVFFVDSAAHYVELEKGGVRFFLTHPRNAWVMAPLIFRPVPNPLSLRYWSETPYALGPTAVKYSALPCNSNGLGTADHSHHDYLREAMTATLASQSTCFQFAVQLQKDARKMPIENPTIEWNENDSPFIPVAKITVAAQSFDSAEQMDFCENLSMTPWHSLPEHRPLGGINRTRRAVYTTISKLRHDMNNAPRREPEP